MKTINKQLVTTALISIIVSGGVGYYIGTHKQATPTRMQGAFGQGGAGQGQRGGFARGGVNSNMINGDVVSLSDNILTVKGRDGGSRVVLFTGTTKVTKSVTGERGDVKEGSSVLIIGAQNTDGSVTAESVQIRPNGSSSPMR
jgi:hypothetical protein